jgi:hypothetical protein
LPDHCWYFSFHGETVDLRDCMLPEFDRTKRICGCKALVFDSECNYDVIVGRQCFLEILV